MLEAGESGDHVGEGEGAHDDVNEDEAYEDEGNEDEPPEGDRFDGGTQGAGDVAGAVPGLGRPKAPAGRKRPAGQEGPVACYFMCRWPGCLYGAADRAVVAEHYGRHVLRPHLACTYQGCAAVFDHPAALSAHRVAQHRPGDPQLVRCSHHACPAAFHSAAEAQAHETASHQTPVPVCPWGCGRPYASGRALQQHMVARHVGAGEPRDWQCSTADQAAAVGGAWGCSFFGCGTTWPSEDQLDQHCASHIRAPYACTTAGCGQAFAVCSQFVRHMRNDHGQPMADETRLEWHRCCYGGCGLLLDGVKELRAHMRMHASSHGWPCSTCGEGFPSEARLKAHRLSHIEPRPSPADGPLAADTLPPLDGHADEEDGPPRKRAKESESTRGHHVCPWEGCGKVLPYRSRLDRHMDSHLRAMQQQAQQHLCTFCNAPFPSRRAMYAHRTSHVEQAPFRCDQAGCVAVFNFRSNLDLHRRTVHGTEP